MNEPSPMSKDEENILRYACGFVAMKLKKRFLKRPCEKSAKFIYCLRKMVQNHHFMIIPKSGLRR